MKDIKKTVQNMQNIDTSMPNAEKTSKKSFIISVIPILFSILITILILVLFISFLAVLAGHIYALRHPICRVEEDLGYGFAMMKWATIAFGCAILLFFPLYKYISKKISKFIGGNYV